jgi:uncharacterized protein (DUF1015 family)
LTLIRPFRALRPAPGKAEDVIAPPYDVLSSDEARKRAKGRPWSFLHISKPEIDLDPSVHVYSEAVYKKAADNLANMIEAGILERDAKPNYYVYRVTMGDHSQTGLVAAASLEAYRAGRIRKHEFTTPAKENDRIRQIEALKAQTGPVMMAYPASPQVDALLAQLSADEPALDVTADDGVRHTLWVVDDDRLITEITGRFEDLAALYIADGHHRSAAADKVDESIGETDGGDDTGGFLTVIFPADQMNILDYNRVIADLNGHDAKKLIAEIENSFSVEPVSQPMRPAMPGEFGMYLAGSWYRLKIKPELVPGDDPLARLDISLLSKHLIEPLLGISDPRRDKRIDFVGGSRGLEALQARVNSGEMAIAFALYPTAMADVLAVADAGEVMPPKSTWFEPKLADGLVSLVLD